MAINPWFIKTLVKRSVVSFSSSEIMHKAGVPKEHRDMMQITIITYPKKYYEKYVFF